MQIFIKKKKKGKDLMANSQGPESMFIVGSTTLLLRYLLKTSALPSYLKDCKALECTELHCIRMHCLLQLHFTTPYSTRPGRCQPSDNVRGDNCAINNSTGSTRHIQSSLIVMSRLNSKTIFRC